MRSVKRMAKRVCGATSSRQAFECIAYNIPKMVTKEAVETLFDVLVHPEWSWYPAVYCRVPRPFRMLLP